jgi:uncharacterized protein
MLEELPDEFWQAIEEFNQGEFYACHDTLEAIWIEAPSAEKNFFQGILQIAVGLYHLGNQNWRGAVILLGEGLNRLRKYQPDDGGIHVEQLIDDASELLTELQTLGADRVSQVVLTLDQSQPVTSGQIFLQRPIIQKLNLRPE